MNENKDLNFVLFHPVSICISGEMFKYCIKKNLSYPCLLGFITEESFGTGKLKCVEVITGRKFDIINEEDYERPYHADGINTSKVMRNPALVDRSIKNSLENLQLIEKYIDTKGNLSQNEIAKSSDFSYRLNYLLSNRPIKYYSIDGEPGFYDTLKRFEFSKYYLQRIDIENLKEIKEIEYVMSGQKDSYELAEKNDIILRLTKKLTPPKQNIPNKQ